MMRIAGTEINLQHKAFEIYLSGCNPPHCKGCHNPELWDFSQGDYWIKAAEAVVDKISSLKESGLVEIIWILGGEPLDQNQSEMIAFLTWLKLFDLPLMVWTHYTSLPLHICRFADYAKMGPYKHHGEPYVEPVFGIKLANKMQYVIKIKDNDMEGEDAQKN